MGEVVSLEEFRRARAGFRGDVVAAREDDEAQVVAVAGGEAFDRLERAVRSLESALVELEDAGALDEPLVRRELVAVTGAVSSGRYALAAARTERLARRLQRA